MYPVTFWTGLGRCPSKLVDDRADSGRHPGENALFSSQRGRAGSVLDMWRPLKGILRCFPNEWWVILSLIKWIYTIFCFFFLTVSKSSHMMSGFVCQSGLQAILSEGRCDGVIDCHDYSDEIGCGSMIYVLLFLIYKVWTVLEWLCLEFSSRRI